MISTLYISWACPRVGQRLAAAASVDSADELARLGDRLSQAQEIIHSWTLQQGGKPVFGTGQQGCLQVPADRLATLARVCKQVQDYVGTDYHFGIGVSVKESYEALRQAYETQEPWSFYDPHSKPQPVVDAQSVDAQLGEVHKAQNDGHDHWFPAEGGDAAQTHGGPQDPNGVARPGGEDSESGTATQSVAPTEDAGSQSGSAEDGDSEGSEGGQQDPRQMVAQALLKIKEQAKAIQVLRDTKPEAFEAVKNIVQALVVMAHQMSEAPEDVQKAETLWKRLRLPEPKPKVSPGVKKFPAAAKNPTLGGAIHDGKAKVLPQDPRTGAAKAQGWNQMTAGAIMGPHGSAVSSREPNTE